MNKLSGNAARCAVFLNIPLLAAAIVFSASAVRCETQALPEELDLAEDTTVAEVETFRQAAVYSGYRFISTDGNPASAAPYMRLKPGVTGGFSAATVGTDLKLSADAQFLHSDEYNSALSLDYAGLYRMKLESSSLWHNLERLATASIAPLAGPDPDSGKSYGARTVINRASNRIRLGNNPIHLNLNYWQLTREGTTQQRFSDFDFATNYTLGGATAGPASVDNVTREGTAGLDAHLGPLNAAYTFLIRDFSNLAADQRDMFSGFIPPMAHDVINDSRVISHLFKLYSDLSGGLVTSAAYSLTQRQSSTDRGDARASGNPADKLQTVAGDISYTPFNQLTLNMKYRRLQIDREAPSAVSSPFSLPSEPARLSLRPATNSVRDTVILSASYRPLPKAIYRFEYRAELEARNNLPDNTAAGSVRNDSRQTHTGKVSFIWKPVNGIRLNTSYSYAVTDNPAYPASFGERHSGQALISYTSDRRWGISASYLGRYESGESIALQTVLPRETMNSSASFSAWLSPLEQLTFNASYSFLQTETNQNSLFYYSGVMTVPVLTRGSYRNSAHVYSLDTVLAATRRLDLSLALQQAFSNVNFSASDNSTVATYSSAGIGDSSRLVATETGLTTRADLHLSKHLGCSLGYSLRLYNSGQPLLDGSAHETLLVLTGRW